MDWEGKWLKRLLVGLPTAMLMVFFVVPLASLVVFSFYTHVSGHGLYEARFTVGNYLKALSPFYLLRLWFTVWFAALTAAVCVALAVPFTYVVARLRSVVLRKWLMGLTVSTLWLTTVVRAFGWSVLLSRTAGVGKWLAVLGILPVPHSYAPGFLATLIGMTYIYFPFMVLSLYGALREMNPELEEASLSLGATPARTFVNVVLPSTLNAIKIGAAFVFLLTVGTFIIPDVLGQPPQWNTAVLITDAVAYNSDIPFGAALAIVLAVAVGVLLLLLSRVVRMPRRT
jgi:putative spermidine/putrescine transport system permease protein